MYLVSGNNNHLLQHTAYIPCLNTNRFYHTTTWVSERQQQSVCYHTNIYTAQGMRKEFSVGLAEVFKM